MKPAISDDELVKLGVEWEFYGHYLHQISTLIHMDVPFDVDAMARMVFNSICPLARSIESVKELIPDEEEWKQPFDAISTFAPWYPSDKRVAMSRRQEL